MFLRLIDLIEDSCDTVQKEKDFLDARHLRQLPYFALCRLRLLRHFVWLVDLTNQTKLVGEVAKSQW